MKNFVAWILFNFLCSSLAAQLPRVVGDCTVTYSLSFEGGKNVVEPNAGVAKVFYVRGKQARVDLLSSGFSQTIIYDNTTGEAIVLKEIGNNKYMTKLNQAKWKEENKQFEGMEVSPTSEFKNIMGYDCVKALIKLTNGKTYSLYYTTAIIPSTTENPYQFKNIPGFVLEYETVSQTSSEKITYSATKINMSPVPLSKFEIPKYGYRILEN